MFFYFIGEKCNELDARIHIFSGKYVEHCPCEKGLYCEPTKTEEEGFVSTFLSPVFKIFIE